MNTTIKPLCDKSNEIEATLNGLNYKKLNELDVTQKEIWE